MAPIVARQLELSLGPATADPFLETVRKIRVPSVDYVLKVCGPNTESRSKTIESACHGFEEITALKELYPFMNFIEAIYLAATAFDAKKIQVKEPTLRETLERWCVDQLTDLVHVQNMFSAEHTNMNPFPRNTKNSLTKRLSSAPPEHIAKFMDSIQQPARKYVFPPYYGNDHNVTPMRYQLNSPRYDGHGKMYKDDRRIANKRFADHIVRMISKY